VRDRSGPGPARPLSEWAEAGEAALNFTMERWCLWQPGVVTPDIAWPGGAVVPGSSEKDGLDFLPMMQRRRLSPLARAAMAVAWHCRGGLPAMPAVFYSRHGESGNYLEMLQDLADRQELSPSRFSLSVHNAIAGLYSLCSGSEAACVSLAGSVDDLFAAFLEATGLLAESGCARVLLVFYEQPLPEVYRAFATGPGRVVALALILAAPGVAGPRLRLLRKRPEAHEPACQIERLCEAVLRGERRSAAGAAWQWELDDG